MYFHSEQHRFDTSMMRDKLVHGTEIGYNW